MMAQKARQETKVQPALKAIPVRRGRREIRVHKGRKVIPADLPVHKVLRATKARKAGKALLAMTAHKVRPALKAIPARPDLQVRRVIPAVLPALKVCRAIPAQKVRKVRKVMTGHKARKVPKVTKARKGRKAIRVDLPVPKVRRVIKALKAIRVRKDLPAPAPPARPGKSPSATATAASPPMRASASFKAAASLPSAATGPRATPPSPARSGTTTVSSRFPRDETLNFNFLVSHHLFSIIAATPSRRIFMNRVHLSAFAAALLLAFPANIPAQEKTMTTSTGMELVWIPPGEFVMGSTQIERDWANANGCPPDWTNWEGDQTRRVEIKVGLWLGRTELTLGQWKKFVNATGYVTDAEKNGGSQSEKPDWKDPKFGFKLKDNHPVCCMSWNDAVAFCQWLTDTEKKANKLPTEMICRLPTESEWEYACRAGTQSKFWWGDSPEGGKGRLNWPGSAEGFQFVAPVDNYGAHGRNKFGLADMLGNVREWCLDGWDPMQSHAELYMGSSPAAVQRGGAFKITRGTVRCAYRCGQLRSGGNTVDGFRVCCGVPDGSGHLLGTIASIPKAHAKIKTEVRNIPVGPIMDAEMQKNAKKFARTQSSIKGLYIQLTSMGQRMGGAQDIIATVERANSNMETVCDIFGDVAKDTRISMEEAERLLKVRYPIWQAGHKIRFSYGNKYTKQAGGSAGGAFSVLLLSLLDGFQIDSGFSMTGDVTVDGKIRAVGAVAEKIRGAMLERCSVVAIPQANKETLNDLAILYSPSMLWSIQILSISTLDNAAAVARLDRDKYLANALSTFYQIQRGLGPNAPVAFLRNQDTNLALQQVLQLAPNHLSAEFMLRAANNQLPTTLSLSASMEEIWAASALMRGYLLDDKPPDAKKNTRYRADNMPAEAIKVALDRLTWLDTRLHPKTKDLKNAMYDYIQSLDNLRRQSGGNTVAYSHNLAKRDKVLGEVVKLGMDKNALEELMH